MCFWLEKQSPNLKGSQSFDNEESSVRRTLTAILNDGSYAVFISIRCRLTQPAAPCAAQKLKVLYVFAGMERKADINFYLRTTAGLLLEISEIDVLRDPCAHDVTRLGVWGGIMDSLKAGAWDVLVITPPCNTWSRLPW